MAGGNQSMVSGSMIGTPRGKFDTRLEGDNRVSNIGAGELPGAPKIGHQK